MKAKRIVTLIISALAIAMVTFSGIMKLTGNAEVAKTLTDVGVGQYITWLGIAEILFAALFAFPQTMRIGFILLACYFSGALATELSHHTKLSALVPMVLIWIAAFLRDKSIFLPSPKKQQVK